MMFLAELTAGLFIYFLPGAKDKEDRDSP